MIRVIRSIRLVPLTLLLLPVAARPQSPDRLAQMTPVLRELIEAYGVSGDEARVREIVLRQLPSWAKPQVDTAGNVWVRVGQGDPVVGEPRAELRT